MSIERYELNAIIRMGEPVLTAHEKSDGAWVRYSDYAAERARRIKAEAILDSFSDPGSDWKVLLSIKEYRAQYPRVEKDHE